jgi:hypothetical protein
MEIDRNHRSVNCQRVVYNRQLTINNNCIISLTLELMVIEGGCCYDEGGLPKLIFKRLLCRLNSDGESTRLVGTTC